MKVIERIFLVLLMLSVMVSCVPSYQIASEDIKIDFGDYVFPRAKKSVKASVKYLEKLYEAETVKISGAMDLNYDSTAQKYTMNEYWLEAIILNSVIVDNTDGKDELENLSRAIAKDVVQQISNDQDYDKIEIILKNVQHDGIEDVGYTFFFTLPNLETIDPVVENIVFKP